MNLCLIPPDAERGPCELCGQIGILTYYGNDVSMIVCDDCRVYFAYGFNISLASAAHKN